MPETNTKHFVAVGECMVELVQLDKRTCQVGFAGDTLNALIYAKRWMPSVTCSFFSAIGTDNFSTQMLDFFAENDIATQAVFQSRSRNVGLYSIVTDHCGERSFDYWRDQSAAKSMMCLYRAQQPDLGAVDMLYFSGIALGILSDGDKDELFAMLRHYRKQGATIAFDPNYRASMWSDVEHARFWYDNAYRIANIALPGMDDHLAVYDHHTTDQVVAHLNKLGCDEFVLKASKAGMFGYQDGELVHHQPFNPAPQQVDSTAAGDSFAGVYLVNRLAGTDVANSMLAADAVAREVVQHKGAIVDDSATARVQAAFYESKTQGV